MTLDELFSRVVRGHLRVILLIALLPLGAVLALDAAHPADWRASVRIQATSAVPTSSTEAEGLSSRVLAIATTPSVVRASLAAADLQGDAIEVSEKHVSAQRLGESPVVELSVTEPDAKQARKLVDELSKRVLVFMNNADRGRYDNAVEDVDQRLADARSQRDRLARRVEATSVGDARNRLVDLLAESNNVVSELSRQRANLVMADITRGQAVLVDGDSPTVVEVPSGLAPRLALALVLGLCLAVATAAAIETLRPRVPDARGLARLLDTPVLTTTKQAPSTLAHTLALVARRNGLDTVVILPANPSSATEQAAATALARSLSRGASEHRVLDPVLRDGAGAGADHDPADRVDGGWTTRFVDLASLQPHQEVGAGIAVICSGAVPHDQVEELQDVLRATRWPLIGVLDAGGAWDPSRPEVWSAGEEIP